uniref:Uncharacterized protein n=1 Tax=Meloidogyne enterolobii TaxID=390850 RepID=A0A6V7WFZ5_MELEN|nr:unnamed protein product [Meloidogyne enterolobii]
MGKCFSRQQSTGKSSHDDSENSRSSAAISDRRRRHSVDSQSVDSRDLDSVQRQRYVGPRQPPHSSQQQHKLSASQFGYYRAGGALPSGANRSMYQPGDGQRAPYFGIILVII